MAIQNTFPAIKPSLNLDFANTRQLDPRITFTRASAATYYDGKTVAKAEENLFIRSQEFDAGGAIDLGWQKYAIAVTANAEVAPDGTTTADRLNGVATSALQGVKGARSAFSGSSTVSVYAKADTGSVVQIAFDTDASQFANFALATGALGTSGGTGMSPDIVDVGGGWYRCIVTITSATATNVYFSIQTSTSAARLASTVSPGAVFLWGAQVEQRSFVTAYTPTTTQPITNYIPALQTAPAGVARFDHDPITGESLGLLIEEQRTNLLTYSADLSNAAWLKTGASVTGDAVVAPDGTLTADLLVEDTTTGEHRVRVISVAKSANAVMTLSIYVKPAGRYVILALEFGGVGLYTNFDVLTNQYWDFAADTGWTRGQTVITSVGNGWYRCSISGTTSADLSVTARVHLASVAGFNKNASYAGNGTSGIYLWGAQLEVGAFPTSYIPTIASQVTRSADAASMTGTNFSSWYNSAEGTFYAHFQGGRESQQTGYGRVISIGPSGGTSALLILGTNSATNAITAWFGGIAVVAPVSGADYWGVGGKAATSYSAMSNTTTIVGNGLAPATGTGYPSASTGAIGIGGNLNLSTNMINGRIRRITYYPKRLSNTELQSITS